MKRMLILGAVGLLGSAAYAQSAIDAYRLSQPDMKGTARFMGMGGAFGALGGDLSTISQNPAGIGVYRNREVGVTFDLDLQSSNSSSMNYLTGIGFDTNVKQTKFLLNNIGFVWTFKIPSNSCPNINFGFTYNKSVSFNRKYRGAISLNGSLSNYLAAYSNNHGYSPDMLLGDDNYDPYNPPYGYASADWLPILGYEGWLFSNQPVNGQNHFVGQWRDGQNGTKGTGYFDVIESGGVDSYNIALGGNIANVVYWGMDFDITHLNYKLTTNWREDLENARVEGDDGRLYSVPANWRLQNWYNCRGTGFNYKLGVIVKPIQELRLGFAFHTPTWYGFTEDFNAKLDFQYDNNPAGSVQSNYGVPGYNDVNFRTPWKIIASAATVLFNKLIISADYEWTQYKGMKYSLPSYGYGGDYWYDDPWYDDPWYYGSASASTRSDYISSQPFGRTNYNVTKYYRNTNTLRLGAEFRVTPQLSVRAGYAFVSSPVNADIKNKEIDTAGTIPNYRWDNTTNYITCGLGYKVKNFYIDAAYVYKAMSAEYHAYSPINNAMITSPVADVNFHNSQIVLSIGFKY